MQSTGTFFAAARLSGATAPPAYVLSRSVGLQVRSFFVLLFFQNWNLIFVVAVMKMESVGLFIFLYQPVYENKVPYLPMQGIGLLLEGIFGAAVGNTASV